MSLFSKTIVTMSLLLGLTFQVGAQIMRDYVNDAEHSVNGLKPYKRGANGGPVTSAEVADGLRQALQVGAQKATARVSAVDGFLGNALIKILMPPEARKVENTLREAGMGSQVDNAIVSMNRAAEDASSKALQIFIDAIKGMSIDDAMKILKGDNDAATQYLKMKLTSALTAAFRPVVEESLDKVNATKYWADVFDTYNDLPTTFKKVNPDLPAYVTERTLNGLFVNIADEEARIRRDPAARGTDLLKKVFGSH